MGDRTYARFKTSVASAINRGTLDATLVGEWIHDAIREFAYAFKMRELQKIADVALTAGVNLVPLPSDFRAVAEEGGIWITSPQDRVVALIPESRRQYLGKVDLLDTTNRGTPSHFHTYGNSLYLRGVPDATAMTIQLHYWARITKMVNDGDVSQFDDDWDDVIFTGALYRGYRHFGEFDRYQNVRNDFLGLVRSRVLDEDLEPFPEGGISLAQEADFNVDEIIR